MAETSSDIHEGSCVNPVIHVTNKLPNNGTALHGHGLRQWFSVGQDGVPGVTQCKSSFSNGPTRLKKGSGPISNV